MQVIHKTQLKLLVCQSYNTLEKFSLKKKILFQFYHSDNNLLQDQTGIFCISKVSLFEVEKYLSSQQKRLTIVTRKCESIPFKMTSPNESCGRLIRQTLKYPKGGRYKTDYRHRSFEMLTKQTFPVI